MKAKYYYASLAGKKLRQECGYTAFQFAKLAGF